MNTLGRTHYKKRRLLEGLPSWSLVHFAELILWKEPALIRRAS